MVVSQDNKEPEFYDLSSLVMTLQVAMIKNMENGRNIAHQMVRVLDELSIIENSNFYDEKNINSFSNMLKNIN